MAIDRDELDRVSLDAANCDMLREIEALSTASMMDSNSRRGLSLGKVSRSRTSVRRPASTQNSAQLDPAGPPPRLPPQRFHSQSISNKADSDKVRLMESRVVENWWDGNDPILSNDHHMVHVITPQLGLLHPNDLSRPLMEIDWE